MSQEDKNLNAFTDKVNALYNLKPGGKFSETFFDADFQDLKSLSAELKRSDKEEYQSLAGQIPENKKKNRYKDITPFDCTRVKLTATNDDPDSDYINASFIGGAERNHRYIASQGPLPHTVLDFWQMLWQYNVSVIVMVCREIELGKKKCERYWADCGERKEFGEITVTLDDKKELKDGYCLRVIKAVKGNESRTIHQFHYTSWPDHGVPKTCLDILTLINHVRDVQSYCKDEKNPLCVHCSAGCGRTGAVLVIDYVRSFLERKSVPCDLNTFGIISNMRRQRPAIVQTKDQYEFVNMAIVEMFHIYMQTRTLSYKGFTVGYEGEQYVNIQVSSEGKLKDRKSAAAPPPRPKTLQYENINLKNHPQDGTKSLSRQPKLSSLEDYPAGSPPAKPSLGRLGVTDFAEPSYSNYKGRKQSAPNLPVFASPRLPNMNSNVRTGTSHNRNASGSPISAGKEAGKLHPPVKPKTKPEPDPKNSLSALMPKSPGGSSLRPSMPLKPKGVEEKRTPLKPQRSIRRNPPGKKAGADAPGPSSPSDAKNNFQTYQKKSIYSDVPLNNGGNTPQTITEGDYADIPSQTAGSNNIEYRAPPSPNNKTSAPKLPTRTPESQMLLSGLPPALPSRTAESYEVVEVDADEMQAYEAVDTSASAPPLGMKNTDVGRRTSSNPTTAGNLATNVFAAKAKKMFENTTNAFSKVGASIAKSVEDDNSGPLPSTLENRTPTYVFGPVLYGGQDMSFGKRPIPRVRGGRKPT